MQNVMFNTTADSEDVVASALGTIARNILIGTFVLLPLFIVPAVYAPFGFSKVLLVVVGVFVAIIFYSLSALRSGSAQIRKAFIFTIPWLVAGSVGLSAMFSGDVRDSLIGSGFSVHTALFVALVALIISIIPILGQKKTSLMNLYIGLAAAALVLGVYHLLRLFFGAEFLSLGLFVGSTSTPLGGWNDLAIFFGLSLLLALVTIEQLPLTNVGRWVFITVSVIALIILSVVNFSAIWFVLGFVSLVMLMYALTKNRFKSNSLVPGDEGGQKTVYSAFLSTTVFIFSFAFIVGGSGLSSFISGLTGISYVEVRPSFSATMDITRGVYGENAFTGIGANKFTDAWKLYKDASINQTVFWNTSFNSGIGYLPTFAATAGIVGMVSWLIFLASIIFVGVRILISATVVDRFWYFMGTSSFVSAAYLWGVSLLYVPGPSVVILAAVFTGILYTSYIVVTNPPALSIAFGENRRTGFALVLVTMMIIIGSVSMIYVVSKQYGAQLTFNRAVISAGPGVSVEEIERDVLAAYNIANDDRFLREITTLQLAKMNTLTNIQDPNEAQIQQYQTSLSQAVQAGELSVNADATDSANWQTLAAVYSRVIAAAEDEAYTRTRQALQVAESLDPKNPEIQLQFAQMESRAGNLDAAREYALRAVQLKTNYSEAYLFVAQIDIARGDVEAAINSATAIATLEPRNPARHYQLGILHTSNNNPEAAARSFERAVQLNNSYANARYFLALAYSQLGRNEEAIEQLTIVRDLNPDNGAVAELIARLQNGESLEAVSATDPIQINETESVSGTSLDPEDVPDSPLLTPVNAVPENEEDTEVDAVSAEVVESTLGSSTEQ